MKRFLLINNNEGLIELTGLFNSIDIPNNLKESYESIYDIELKEGINYLLVKAYDLLVDKIEVFNSYEDAKSEFKKYTGVDFVFIQKIKNGESTDDSYNILQQYDRTYIYEINTNKNEIIPL